SFRMPVLIAIFFATKGRAFFRRMVRHGGDGSCFCFTSPFGRLRSGSPFSQGSRLWVIVTGVWPSKPVESRLSLSARLHCGIKSEFVMLEFSDIAVGDVLSLALQEAMFAFRTYP